MSYVEANQRQFDFVRVDDMPNLSTDQRSQVLQHWHEINPDGHLFNGNICCASGINDDGERLTIVVNSSDYATYKLFRDTGQEIPGTYAMGVGTFVFDPEKQAFVFTVRSTSVGFDQGKICAASGGVLSFEDNEPWPDAANFLDVIKRRAETETEEELTVKNLSDHKLLGAYIDEKTFKIEFLFLATATNCQIKDASENVALLYVPKGQLTQFLNENRDKLETSTLWHLEHWAETLDRAPNPTNFKSK